MLLLTKRAVAFVEIGKAAVDREIATGDHQYN